MAANNVNYAKEENKIIAKGFTSCEFVRFVFLAEQYDENTFSFFLREHQGPHSENNSRQKSS